MHPLPRKKVKKNEWAIRVHEDIGISEKNIS